MIYNPQMCVQFLLKYFLGSGLVADGFLFLLVEAAMNLTDIGQFLEQVSAYQAAGSVFFVTTLTHGELLCN